MKQKRTPRPLRIPIMRSTIDVLSQELRFGLLAANAGYFSEKNFYRIAGVVNLVSIALQGREVDKSVEAAIDGCIRCLNEIDAQAERTGKWVVSDWQSLAIEAGIQKIEQILPSLTVTELRRAKDILERIKNVP